MITKTSVFPIAGMIFHPTYMLVNAKLLGQTVIDETFCATDAAKGKSECLSAQEYVAAFGLASSALGIVYLALGFCFAYGLANVMP
jgi:hypothetical protein